MYNNISFTFTFFIAFIIYSIWKTIDTVSLFKFTLPLFLLYLPAETLQIMKQTRAHEGSVFAMCVLQGGAILSGGGKDRKIIRWSADLAPERECEVGHESVLSLKLCVCSNGSKLSNRVYKSKTSWMASLLFQISEKFGAVRTIADVDGEELLVGTTRNAILRGTFSDGFVAVVQVDLYANSFLTIKCTFIYKPFFFIHFI